MPAQAVFSTPPLILFDTLRILAGIACLVLVCITPYAVQQREMKWSQRVRFIGSAALSVALISSYIQNLGTLPPVPWRTLLGGVGAIAIAVGSIFYVKERDEPQDPVIRNTDRLENVNAAFVIANDEGRIITASGMCQTVIGWQPSALIGRPLATLIPVRYLDAHFAGMQRMADTGETRIAGIEQSMSVMTRERVERPIRLVVLPLPQQEPEDTHRYLGIMMRPQE